jgi:hypothetical protein
MSSTMNLTLHNSDASPTNCTNYINQKNNLKFNKKETQYLNENILDESLLLKTSDMPKIEFKIIEKSSNEDFKIEKFKKIDCLEDKKKLQESKYGLTEEFIEEFVNSEYYNYY